VGKLIKFMHEAGYSTKFENFTHSRPSSHSLVVVDARLEQCDRKDHMEGLS
jgi:hypothetical protein